MVNNSDSIYLLIFEPNFRLLNESNLNFKILICLINKLNLNWQNFEQIYLKYDLFIRFATLTAGALDKFAPNYISNALYMKRIFPNTELDILDLYHGIIRIYFFILMVDSEILL